MRGVPRRALQPRDAGRELARQEHRRRVADGSRRGGGVLRVDAQHQPSAAVAQGCGAGLSHAGPAFADAVGRRGAAHQARDRTQQGARRRHAARQQGAAHAVRARRADGGAAHGGRREADPRAAPAGERRAQRGRDRA